MNPIRGPCEAPFLLAPFGPSVPRQSSRTRKSWRSGTLILRRFASMKVCRFHLMPHRELPADFAERFQSAYLDPVWFDVADADRVGQYFNWTLDELIHAAKSGM